jgi:sigma-B regulation protein RsbU (phosphoserine phosphatase)
MIEAPNFEYKYELALYKSFAARLSLAILLIAAGVFLVAILAFFYFQQEQVKEQTASMAKAQLHDAVMRMRLSNAEAQMQRDTMTTDGFIRILQTVQPYKNSFTLMVNDAGELLYTSNDTILGLPSARKKEIITVVLGKAPGMEEVFEGSNLSLLIHEPVQDCRLYVAVVCSRVDILSIYKPFLLYGSIAFFGGLLVLFLFCAFAIYRMVAPLHLFAESARSIADGNMDTPLPEIHSEDELRQLRDSFDYMQTSLKQYIKDLQVTTASKERLLSELVIAHDIQMGMIPTTFPHRQDLDLFASMIPAKEVGGDLYDFIIEGDQLSFIIGDVAGKGVPASLYMAVTRTLFRNLAGNYQSAANIVREMNHAIASTNDSFVFVTLFVGVLDMKTHHLNYCNAAHNAPVLLTANGDCRLLNVEVNLPVGIEDRYHYEDQQIDFPLGSSLLLYTDGLTEAVYVARNGNRRLFGEDRMLYDLEINRNASAQEMVEYLNHHVAIFGDGTEQCDDITLLFLRHGIDGSQHHPYSMPNHILLKNEMTEISRVKSFFFSVCREYGIDDELGKSLNLALEEWVANVINYAYHKGSRGHIDITAEMNDDLLRLVIKDSGIPFDPTSHGEADTRSELENRPIGGLGIFLIRSIMDDFSYQRTADGYNIVTLTKHIHHQ